MKDSSKYAYNIKEAAEYLATSKTVLYCLRRSGCIKGIKTGRFYIFPKKELDHFMDRYTNDIEFKKKVNEVRNESSKKRN